MGTGRKRLILWLPALVFGLAFVLLPVFAVAVDWGSALWAAILALPVVAGGALLARDRLPRWLHPAPALGAMVVAGLLRDASGAGDSGYGPLALVPVMWLALYGGVAEIALGLVGVAVVFWLPVAVGASGYPNADWSRGAFMLLVAATFSLTLLRVVRDFRLAARRTDLILERSHDAFISIDGQGVIIDWNPAAERTFGWRRGEAIGRRLSELIVPARYRESHERGRERYLATGEGPLLDRQVEIEALRRDGSEFPIELSISVLDTPEGLTFNAFVRDTSERQRAQELTSAQHHTAAILASAVTLDDALPDVLRSVGDGLGWDVTVYWAPMGDLLRARNIWHDETVKLGPFLAATQRADLAAPEGLPGRAWATGAPAPTDDLGHLSGDPRAHAAEQCGLRSAVALPVLTSEGPVGVLELSGRAVVDVDERTLQTLSGVASQLGLFAERVRRSELLLTVQETARTDPLTGQLNRRGWDEELPRAIARAGRSRQPMCLAMIDLDHFKAFNDGNGHLAGDRLLQGVASDWRTQLRSTDVLARFGGDEFAAIFPDCDLDTAIDLVNRLRAAVPAPVTCSIGVALWDGSESRWSLLDRADLALYDAKASGRNCAVGAERGRVAQRLS